MQRLRSGYLITCLLTSFDCRCATEGKLYGPYQYAYREQGRKLKSWHIGKELKLLEAEDSSKLSSASRAQKAKS